MKYTVATVIDDEETCFGVFESITASAEWAHNNLSTWWWVIRINEIEGDKI